MCGIAGICDIRVRTVPEKENLERMAKALAHRGPDDEGFYRAPGVGLAHRRLSIIGLDSGKQPLSNEDETLWLVFNGEIYNYVELREELRGKGHTFKTETDSEVIVHAYEEFGVACLHHFNGMFAFALWDEKERVLFCARDRMGIKPFYYHYLHGHLVFASEVKSILAEGTYQPALNGAVVEEFFTYKYTAWDDTLFSGISELHPGNYAKLDESGWNERPYWNMEDAPPSRDLLPSGDREHQVGQFREMLQDSIRLRLRSDVPVGVFLSGGLDSGALTAFGTELHDQPLSTFSIGYEEADYSELHLAEEVAKRYNTKHHVTHINCAQYIDWLENAIRHKDQPLAHVASVPLYYVSQLARDAGVYVVLSGEGSDELLGGYTQFPKMVTDHNLGKVYSWVPKLVRQGLARGLWDNLPVNDRTRDRLERSFLYNLEDDGYAGPVRVFNNKRREALFTDEFLTFARRRPRKPILPYLKFFKQSKADEFLNKVLYVDLKTHLVRLLKKQDKMSMAASIESRVPFLDHRLVQFCMHLDSTMKVDGNVSKVILRRALGDRLPASVMSAPKMGFVTPFEKWMEGPLLDYCEQILIDDRTRQRGQLRVEVIEQLFREHRGGRKHSTRLFLLANFEIWNRLYFDTAKEEVGAVDA